MKKQLPIMLLIASLFMSCRTNKDLIYMNNAIDEEMLSGVPEICPEHVIQANDNLYVDIQSLDPDINALFRGSNEGSTQQNFGQTSGQYLNGYQVDISGNIILPIIGSVNVAGKTLDEARLKIQKATNQYIKDAVVKVKLLNFKITVLGEVKKPSTYYNYNNNVSILEAISMANGITDYGRIQKVLVLRRTDEGSKTYRLDLTNKKFLSSKAFFLQPNDVVYVEPDKHKNVKMNSSMYSLFLSTISTLILVLRVL